MSGRSLLVEDEEGLRLSISDLLQAEGSEVDTASDGPEGLEMARHATFSLLVLDVMLPGKSGFDILRDLRADPATRSLPVMMLTARGQTRDRELAEKLGVTRFMTKPFSNAEVIENVRALVAG